jgi:hypothetical protein
MHLKDPLASFEKRREGISGLPFLGNVGIM